MANESPRALVLLAAGAEEMEVTITVDVLRRGGVEVVLAGIDGPDAVTCSRGVRLLPDCGLVDAAGDFDAVVLPGGVGGADALCASSDVGRLLQRQVESKRLVAAICAAPTALVAHGIGAGLPMTCHPSVSEVVGEHGMLAPGDVVETEAVITSRGPGTAFDFALALVGRLVDPEVAANLRGPMMLPDAVRG